MSFEIILNIISNRIKLPIVGSLARRFTVDQRGSDVGY